MKKSIMLFLALGFISCLKNDTTVDNSTSPILDTSLSIDSLPIDSLPIDSLPIDSIPIVILGQIDLQGKVIDTYSNNVPNVTIRLVSSGISDTTNENGDFNLFGEQNINITDTLEIFRKGYVVEKIIIQVYTDSLPDILINRNAGTFIDERDGKEYKWVGIGQQIWMAENLDFVTETGSGCYEWNSDDYTECDNEKLHDKRI